jgi:hypothetical protein
VDFNKTNDLPSSVNTVEKLYVWASCLLAEVLPEEQIKLAGSQSPIRRFDYGVTPDFENAPNVGSSFYLELDEGWRSSGNKLWEEVLPVTTLAVPTLP